MFSVWFLSRNKALLRTVSGPGLELGFRAFLARKGILLKANARAEKALKRS